MGEPGPGEVTAGLIRGILSAHGGDDMAFLHRILALICAVLLSACAHTTVVTDVTRFHRLPPSGAGRTFEVAPPRGTGALEAEVYSERIASHLRAYGWRRTSARAAEYIVSYEYGVSQPREVHGAAPIYGQVGSGFAVHSTTYRRYGHAGHRYGTFGSTLYIPPTYGVIGAVPVSSTVYDRWIRVIGRGPSGAEVFQIRGQSSGAIPEISRVLPAMIDSAFEDFPGLSGKSVRYRQDIED
jgi:hypothetical protein